MPGARASRYRVYGVIGLHIGNYPNYPSSFLLFSLGFLLFSSGFLTVLNRRKLKKTVRKL